MNSLNRKEIKFLTALKNDNITRAEKSFLNVLFRGSVGDTIEMRQVLENMFESPAKRNIALNSALVFHCQDSCLVGKYQDSFWATGSEGELFGLGSEIQNIPYVLLANILYDPTTTEGVTELVEYYKSEGIDFLKTLEEYKDFCADLGLVYLENVEEIDKQINAFDILYED